MVAPVVGVLLGAVAKPETHCPGMVLGVEDGSAELSGSADLGGAGRQGQPVATGIADLLAGGVVGGLCGRVRGSVEVQLGCRHEPQHPSARRCHADVGMDGG